ncbi:MAG: phospholipase D-like domain-containing protein [Acidimicrobiales bacterium]
MTSRTSTMLPVLGAGAAVAVGVWATLRATEEPSWPPPPQAITGDNAMAAVADFVAGEPKPGDVGLPYAWSTAASIEPRAGGDEFYHRIFQDIEAATSSVHILMFGWKPGMPAGQLAELLSEKLAAGVEVRILVDSFGSRPHGLSKAMYRGLAEAGAEMVVHKFSPPRHEGLYPEARPSWRYPLPFRADHRKLYVVDGKVAWTGGAGIEDHFHDGRFFDVMVRVTGDVVRLTQAVFLTSFASHRAPLPDDLTPYFGLPPEPGAIPTALAQVVPYSHMSATQATREMIDGATRRLDIMNPYLTDDSMIKKIIDAADRGVAVRIIVSQESNNWLATAALRYRYKELFAAGVDVREYPDAVVHAKLIVADDLVQFGTLNLDAWALYRNLEVAMIAESAETADLFEKRVFAPAIARSEQGSPPTSRTARAVATLADRLTYFL